MKEHFEKPKEPKIRQSAAGRFGRVAGIGLLLILAGCAPEQAGNNPGPFGDPSLPGQERTGTTSGTPDAPIDATPQLNQSPEIDNTIAPTLQATSVPTQAMTSPPNTEITQSATPSISMPTTEPAVTLPTGPIRYGSVQMEIAQNIVPSVTAQILPAPITTTQSVSEITPLAPALTSTLLLLNGFNNLDPNEATYLQPRIMVMSIHNYLPANTPVITPSAAVPFLDALRIFTVSDKQAIFSTGEIRQLLYSQSPALTLRPEVTAAAIAKVQQLDFASGQGVRYLTAFSAGKAPITSTNFYYLYHGITRDQAYYVAAILPLNISPIAITGANETDTAESIATDYEQYVQDIENRLNRDPDDALETRLAEYDRMVGTLAVVSP